MYEDYLETFVFKTAKLIAMKLFGRERKPKKESEEKSEDMPKNEDDDEMKALVEKSNSQENLERNSEHDEELEKILDELKKKQQEKKAKQEKDQVARVEYDSLTQGLDEINFHFPLFFLLIVITILGIPSSITWAKNYHYSRILTPDPFKVPATISLTALGVLWQLNTPRKV